MSQPPEPAMLTASEMLDLQVVGERHFRSLRNQINAAGTIFGGQPLAQALAAAQRTVPDWPAHTCTANFLRGGVVAEPIDYEVEIVRDGRRFAARRVVASQSGKPMFDMLCSFHAGDAGPSHQTDIAATPVPERLLDMSAYVRANADRLPENVVSRRTAPFPVELRLVDPDAMFSGKLGRAQICYWLRMPSSATISDARAHQCLAAFVSDYWLPFAAGAPHGGPVGAKRFKASSINHSMWFHAPIRADDWLLCQSESPWAGDGRALVRGLFYDRAGRLVASVAQEITLRVD